MAETSSSAQEAVGKGGKLKSQKAQTSKIQKSMTELNITINALRKLNAGGHCRVTSVQYKMNK